MSSKNNVRKNPQEVKVGKKSSQRRFHSAGSVDFTAVQVKCTYNYFQKDEINKEDYRTNE